VSKHRLGCLHCLDVDEYRAAREADWLAMEADTALYPGDVALWRQSHTMITFQKWLIGKRQPLGTEIAAKLAHERDCP
jgi:hypothetical protein